ncbi:DNA-processing protein DprA [Desulfurispira natronophila]|uniref:DNA processing protein n=1 Tax=Desulfurispira natronophila TaxID=682562 RepID=A0A7W7Y5X8_9BACT|nr:DNA-processing protein DprA [Desulfurispira natronophila]MBB5022693.1 DNA processing protein [Desulfurispira natronophila]
MQDYFYAYALREFFQGKIYRDGGLLLQNSSLDELALTQIPQRNLELLRKSYDDELQQLASLTGVWVLTLDDEQYPSRLRHIADPPLILYGRGALPGHSALAMVGSRGPTEYGKMVARKLAAELGEAGLCIVSGLARGIDSVAHQAASGTKGSTVAVMGCGIDRVYPAGNQRLARKIVEDSGAVITEFSPGTGVWPGNFPRRNRIISGMCLGVIVVEAARKSGTMITARLALSQGREVFAVPGSIYSPKSYGSHDLIREGAHLAGSADDIVAELSLPSLFRGTVGRDSQINAHEKLPEGLRSILSALHEQGPQTAEQLLGCSGADEASFRENLAELELMGYISHRSGTYFPN